MLLLFFCWLNVTIHGRWACELSVEISVLNVWVQEGKKYYVFKMLCGWTRVLFRFWGCSLYVDAWSVSCLKEQKFEKESVEVRIRMNVGISSYLLHESSSHTWCFWVCFRWKEVRNICRQTRTLPDHPQNPKSTRSTLPVHKAVRALYHIIKSLFWEVVVLNFISCRWEWHIFRLHSCRWGWHFQSIGWQRKKAYFLTIPYLVWTVDFMINVIFLLIDLSQWSFLFFCVI